ncbi:MAG: hypothetical protein JWQ07_763 [Ramlibacter sp.]|nr:hypothetical protein [Ramlibacter sp.]
MRNTLKIETLNIAGAFAAGALLVYVLDMQRRRASRRRITGASGSDADARLRERVRSKVNELVSHPRAIEVEVTNGVVRVSGQVLAPELDGLLLRLLDVPGVLKVHNALAAQREL